MCPSLDDELLVQPVILACFWSSDWQEKNQEHYTFQEPHNTPGLHFGLDHTKEYPSCGMSFLIYGKAGAKSSCWLVCKGPIGLRDHAALTTGTFPMLMYVDVVGPRTRPRSCCFSFSCCVGRRIVS